MSDPKGVEHLTRDQIRALAIECGFTLRHQDGGREDLNEDVYQFAERLLNEPCPGAEYAIRRFGTSSVSTPLSTFQEARDWRQDMPHPGQWEIVELRVVE